MHTSRRNRAWQLMVCSLLPLAALSQDLQWEKSYGGKQAEYLFDAVPTADYGFILAGSSLSGKTGNKTSSNQGNLDFFIWKMDEDGELAWQKDFGGSGIDLLTAVKGTADGGFVVAGTSNSLKGFDKKENSRGGSDFWVIKLDAGGGEQWQKVIGGSAGDELTSVAETRDGGFLLGGSSSSGISGDKTEKCSGGMDYWIVRLDRSGNIKWQKTYGGQFEDRLTSLALMPDGGCIVMGYSNSTDVFDKTQKNFGSGDYWVLRLDQDGEIVWQREFGGTEDDHPMCLIRLQDGDLLFGGHSSSGPSGCKTTSNRSGSDMWVFRTDADGVIKWQKGYDFGEIDMLTSLVENPDGSILIGGHAKELSSKTGKDAEGIEDYIALKIDAEGEEIWSRTIGSDGEDVLRKLIATRDGGYLLAGTSNPTAQNNRRKKAKHNTPLQSGNGQQLAGAKTAQDRLNGKMQQGRDAVNDAYSEKLSEAGSVLQDAVGDTAGDNFKVGVGEPGNLLNTGSKNASAGAGDLSDIMPAKLPASRSKSNNLGNSDFWVVKLRDNDKKKQARQNIEAIPNPAQDFTNVIVGYEYTKGTASVYDISGRQVRSFKVTERTIPIDLHGLPEGVYVVQVATDKSTDSVKVIKAKQ